MKTLLAFLLLSFSCFAQDAYVVLAKAVPLRTPDKIVLRLLPGDCVPFEGWSERGVAVRFTVGGLSSGVPWHDAKVVPASDAVAANYRAVLARLGDDLERGRAERQKAADQARLAKAARERGMEELRARRHEMDTLGELSAIRAQLELLNLRR